MLKIIILLFLLFLYIKKDSYEGIENSSNTETSETDEPAQATETAQRGNTAVLQATIETDNKMFVAIGAFIGGLLTGGIIGIIYYQTHTED